MNITITRKDIKAILPDIEDDAMKGLLDLFHERVDAAKDEIDDLTKQLETAKSETAAASAAKDKAEKEYSDFRADVARKENQGKKSDAYRAILKEAGVAEKYIPLIMEAAAGKLDGLELGDDGKFKDAGKLIESIKTERADFISKQKNASEPAANPPTGAGAKKYASKADIIAIKDAAERQQAIADNPEMFGI